MEFDKILTRNSKLPFAIAIIGGAELAKVGDVADHLASWRKLIARKTNGVSPFVCSITPCASRPI
jgi:hypothetical protein